MNKKIILVILTIILILAGVGVGVYLVQQSAEIREKAAPATTINLTTSDTSPQVGQNVSVDLNVNTGENQIMITELYINFDVNRLEALEVTRGTFFINPTTIGPRIDNSAGTIYYVLYLSASATPQNGQGLLASISFRTKASGSATVSIAPNTIVGDTTEQGTVEEGPRNVLVGTTPVTINILGETTASPTPTQVQAQATTTLTPTLTPTSQPGVGGNENTPTLTPTRTPTPTQSQSTSSQSVSPTPTVELPPVPESGISIPTIMGITLGILVIVGSLLLAL